MEEKRRQLRLAWRGSARITELQNNQLVSADARIRNIGRHGFSVVSEDSMARGVTYRFQLDLNGEPLELQGTVIHIRMEAEYFVSGIQIKSIRFMDRCRLNHFLSCQSAHVKLAFVLYSLAAGAVIGFALKLLGFTVTNSLVGLFITAIGFFLILPF